MSHGRKPRRARWPAGDALSLAINKAAKPPAQDIASVIEPVQKAFQALREGVATEWQWSVLASAINVAQAIEKQGVVKGLHEHLYSAELALNSVYRRAMASSTWRATALYYLELDAIDTAVDLHKFQLNTLGRGELMRALDYAQAEVRSSGGRAISIGQTTESHS